MNSKEIRKATKAIPTMSDCDLVDTLGVLIELGYALPWSEQYQQDFIKALATEHAKRVTIAKRSLMLLNGIEIEAKKTRMVAYYSA
jgi:hypothetical protein